MAITPMGSGQTLTAGAVSTADVLSNRIPIDMSPEISRRTENNSPFIQLLQMMGESEGCMGRKFEWMERDDLTNTVTVSSAYTADASAITMADDYKRLRLGDILYYPTTGEYWRVTTAASSAMDSTVDVTPNWPTGSGGSNVPAGAELYLLGNAQDEWSDVRQVFNSDPAAKYNYIQQFRNPFGVSGRLKASSMIGPDEFQYIDEDMFRAFMREREMAALFGTRGISGDITTSGGMKYWMDAAGSACHQRDMTGIPLSLAEFNDYLEDAFWYSSTNEKLMLCGRNISAIINSFGYNKLQVDMEIAKFGINIQVFESPSGVLRIARHKLFTELGMDDEAWVLDLPSIKRRGLAKDGRSVAHLNTGPGGNGLQGNGQDGILYEYAVEEGLEVRNAERLSRIYNIPAA